MAFEILKDGVAQPGQFETYEQANAAAMAMRQTTPTIGIREVSRFEVVIDGVAQASDYESDDAASRAAAGMRQNVGQRIEVRPKNSPAEAKTIDDGTQPPQANAAGQAPLATADTMGATAAAAAPAVSAPPPAAPTPAVEAAVVTKSSAPPATDVTSSKKK